MLINLKDLSCFFLRERGGEASSVGRLANRGIAGSAGGPG
jgi:hypothetical protein